MLPSPDSLVTAAMAASSLNVSLPLIAAWRDKGWLDPTTGQRIFLTVRGMRGRSRLYRWGDLCRAERDTRRSRKSSRRIVALPTHL